MSRKKLSPLTLRRHKGYSFTGIATAFQCYSNDGKILLAKRGQGARDERGTWDNGAGGLKWGLSLIENVKREVLEEYNAVPLNIEFWGYRDNFRTDRNGDNTHWLGMDFGVLIDPKQVKIIDHQAVEKIAWFKNGELPSPLHSEMTRIFEMYKDKYKKIYDLAEDSSRT